MKNHPPFAAIATAGLIAGILDISSAIVLTLIYGGKPMRMLQGIAAGALGPASLQGGAATAFLGLGFHFLIAFTATALYYSASRRLPALVERPFVFGPLYGIAVWLFMQFVVIPLSRLKPRPLSLRSVATQLPIHMVLVGLTIALVLRRFLIATPQPRSGTARSFHPAG